MNNKWGPDPVILDRLYELLVKSLSVDHTEQKKVITGIESLNSLTDFNMYLSYIFLTKQKNLLSNEVLLSVRSIAGLMLKNNIQKQEITQSSFDLIKKASLCGIKEQNREIQSTSSTVLTMLVYKYHTLDILSDITSGLCSNDVFEIEGCLLTAKKIIEDCVFLEKKSIDLISQPCINLLSNNKKEIRLLALETMNVIFQIKTAFLSQAIPTVFSKIQTVFLQEKDMKTTILCLKTLTTFVEHFSKEIEPVFPFIINIMFSFFEQTENTILSLEACEFWLVLLEKSYASEIITPLLPKLIPVALRSVVYEENDTDVVCFLKENEAQGTDDSSNWTLRKASASFLDTLSIIIEENVFFPEISQRILLMLNNTNPLVIEAGVLVLGAVVESVNKNNVSLIVDYILKETNNYVGLVQRISYWALGRYAKKILNIKQEEKSNVFYKSIKTIIKGIQKENKAIRIAAITALSFFCKENDKLLHAEANTIIKEISKTFFYNDFETKRELCITICSFSEIFKPFLEQKENIDLLMKPLLCIWENAEENVDLIIETISTICTKETNSYAKFLLEKAFETLNMYFEEKNDLCTDADEEYDENIYTASACLCLIGEIISKMDDSKLFFSAYKDKILYILTKCIDDQTQQIRQNIFGLFGDMAICSKETFSSFYFSFIPNIIASFKPLDTQEENISISNNAIWAFGEIISTSEYNIDSVGDKCVGILYENIVFFKENEFLETIFVTLGKIFYIMRTQCSVDLSDIIPLWCLYASNMKNKKERMFSLLGLSFYLLKNNISREKAEILITTILKDTVLVNEFESVLVDLKRKYNFL